MSTKTAPAPTPPQGTFVRTVRTARHDLFCCECGDALPLATACYASGKFVACLGCFDDMGDSAGVAS